MTADVAAAPGTGFDALAWSWVDHLRQGGTRPWREWIAGAPGTDPDRRAAGWLPGAAQLEAVRRLAGRPAAVAVPFPELAELVLHRAAPGRGPDDLPLVWPRGGRRARYGPPPVDPAGLPAAELVRVLVGTIVDLLVGVPPEATPPRRRRRHPVRVVGSPAPAASLRTVFTGRPSEDPRPVVVLAEPVDRLLSQAWSLRVQRGGVAPWPRYLDRWARLGTLPPPVDVAGLAARWSDQVDPDRVHVVVAGPDTDAHRTVADLLGLPLTEPSPTMPADLTPAAVELLRRVNRVLRGRAVRDRRRALLRVLVPLLPEGRCGAPVPDSHVPWVRRTAERTRQLLDRIGCQVHGDLDQLLARSPATPPGPGRGDLLAVALDACLAVAQDPRIAATLRGGRR